VTDDIYPCKYHSKKFHIVHTNILPSVHGSSYIVKCPICKKPVFLDESGYKNLPKNNILEAIVEKYCNECKQLQNNTSKCQMCEQLESKEACVMCEQCEIFYCDTCKLNLSKSFKISVSPKIS
jgi:tripartite motif-containing protein 9/67